MLVQFNSEESRSNYRSLWNQFLNKVLNIGTLSTTSKTIVGAINELFAAKLDDVVAGTNVTIDKTDPKNPVINSSGGTGNLKESTGNIFATALDFTLDSSQQIYYNQGVQSGALTFTVGTAPTRAFIWLYTQWQSDGNALNLPSSFEVLKNEYVNDTAIYNMIVFWDGDNYQACIWKAKDIDTTPPTLLTATVENDTKDILDFVFDEAVIINTLGWTISTDGAALTIISLLSGSGTSTPKFQLSRDIVNGETITISYDSNIGDTSDLASNELVSIIDNPVINNVQVILNSLTFINYTNNINYTPPPPDAIYTVFDTGVFGRMASDQSFDGDFEWTWELFGTYGQSGVKSQAFGMDDDNTPNSQANWLINTFIISTTAYVQLGGSTQGSFEISPGDTIKIKRAGSTVTFYKDSGSGFVLVYTVIGSFNETGIHAKFNGYGDATDQTDLYNPSYI